MPVPTSEGGADHFPEAELDAAEDDGSDTLAETTDPDDAAAPDQPQGTAETIG